MRRFSSLVKVRLYDGIWKRKEQFKLFDNIELDVKQARLRTALLSLAVNYPLVDVGATVEQAEVAVSPNYTTMIEAFQRVGVEADLLREMEECHQCIKGIFTTRDLK